MARVKRGVHAKKNHKKVLDRASGYKGAKSRRFKTANEQVMHAMQDSYDHRRKRKGDFRRLWIQRINAASRQHGMSYSTFIAGLKAAEVEVDRKMLADLAINDADAFAQLVEVAKQN
jgi:large subunit ribosomal protein L20